VKKSALFSGAATLCAFVLAPLASAQHLNQASRPLLEESANEALGLRASEVGDVHLYPMVGEEVIAELDLDTGPLFLDLFPYSVRAATFEVRHYIARDTWISVAPGPVTTYRGTLVGQPDTRVAASLLPDGLHARILFPDGSEQWIEPIADHVPAATSAHHVLYGGDSVIGIAGACDADQLAPYSAPTPPQSTPTAPLDRPRDAASGVTIEALGGNTVAEIALDADYEYFQAWGGGTQSRMESVINTMNLQYESQVGITHAITGIVIRTNSNDPYTRKGASQRLNQMRSEWLNNQGSINRDVAHLFTGINLQGTTIGIAWVGAVCETQYHYGLAESNFDSNFACVTDLSAHEIGHNWGAGHCSCTSNTMNSYITCANNFSNGSINSITSYRNSQSCFGAPPPPPPPPADPVSIEVSSIAPSTVNIGQGRKQGRAVVTIVTDTGVAEAGASVSGSFSGDFNESFSGTTDGSGNVTFQTAGFKKGNVNFTFCVTSVSGSLPYIPGNNAETCDNN